MIDQLRVRRGPSGSSDGVDGDGGADLRDLVQVDATLARLGGNHELFLKIMEFFLEDAPLMMEKIQGGLAREDSDEVERGNHGLKGLAANLGAREVEGLSTRLGQERREARWDDARETFGEINTAMTTLNATLQKVLNAAHARAKK